MILCLIIKVKQDCHIAEMAPSISKSELNLLWTWSLIP